MTEKNSFLEQMAKRKRGLFCHVIVNHFGVAWAAVAEQEKP